MNSSLKHQNLIQIHKLNNIERIAFKEKEKELEETMPILIKDLKWF